MEIGRIKGATRVLGKSQGYYGLPVRDEAKNLGDLPHMLLMLGSNQVDGDNVPTMQTVWFPSPDELARLNAGAGIHVSLVGMAHPPISVTIGEAPKPEPKFQEHSLIRSVGGGWRCLRCDKVFENRIGNGLCE